MSALPLSRITPDEYLEIERSAEVKSEYYDGEMFAMSGASLAHSYIPARIMTSLMPQLDRKGCKIIGSDMKVRVSPSGPFVYPDLTIHCGQAQVADDHSDILLNPVVVVEVLSKSSEAYDRGHKFAQYRRIESLRDYVLVSQYEPRIEVFSRILNGQWVLAEFIGLDSICRIPGIEAELALADAYRDITFEAA